MNKHRYNIYIKKYHKRLLLPKNKVRRLDMYVRSFTWKYLGNVER